MNKLAILRVHGIEAIEQDGELFALAVSTLNGRVYAEWENVTRVNVFHWLGY